MRLTSLAGIIFCMSAAACFAPKYENYFEPTAEGMRLASTYCADNRHGPPALAEFVIQSTPIVIYAYEKPEEPAAAVVRIELSLTDGQTLSFDASDVKAIDLATDQKLAVRPDHWSRHFLSIAETHAVERPLNILGQPYSKGGLDRVVVFWTIASKGIKRFSVQFPQLVIGGSALKIPTITFTEKSGVFALPVFGNC